ncbi:patatin-like serine protein [Rutstroemia sp. NJR-2017a BVV2]|nr:patatin-like serine protein [Rutstroemia sp. NJR-2017a BVV2]PQE19710.1 patatin-like serine protein [Rutstroemia sp. NJR-2017a BVV2]
MGRGQRLEQFNLKARIGESVKWLLSSADNGIIMLIGPLGPVNLLFIWGFLFFMASGLALAMSLCSSSPYAKAQNYSLLSPSPSARLVPEWRRSESLAVPSYLPESVFPLTLSLETETLGIRSRPLRPSHTSRISTQSNPKSLKSMKSPPSRCTSNTEPCVVCGSTEAKTFTCIQCNNDTFCGYCWSKERSHRPGAVGFDGKPHEKTEKRVVDRLRKILEPKRTPAEQQEQQKSDEDTTWFGIARDSANMPMFQDYGRYAKIMAQSRTSGIKVRYPQLVSFIGQTGAGKSTLVKMLIEHQDRVADEFSDTITQFPSPVTGSINDNIPTSGDVHLYSDPITHNSSQPMLYADCEGLNGGENVPRGARCKVRDEAAPPAARSQSSNNDQNFRKKLQKVAHSSQRDLAWAVNPETRKREYAVTQLYPRLLYTFSDVVVFVLRNPKVFESTVLEKLLDWAVASTEKSLNQPTLPHVIIALNATDINIDEKQWDKEEATRILMSDIEGAINRIPKFREYAWIWQQKGKRIHTTKDLLECYYSSVTVVRVPTHGRYMLMNEQIGKLDETIRTCCKMAFWSKKRVNMLASAEKLEVYLQSAYDHFSQDLNLPFDLIKEAVKNNPIPRDFGGNILKLAIAIRDYGYFSSGPEMFQHLSSMVASCVMLDSARRNFLGSRVHLFEDNYEQMCYEALESFRNTFWPCNFSSKRYGRCKNVKSGHNPKGHQNSAGKIIAAGQYQSDFPTDYEDTWLDAIRANIAQIEQQVHANSFHQPITGQEPAWNAHEGVMNSFYQNFDSVSKVVSHTTCLSCLGILPEHSLPCGHVLCTPCVEAFGRPVHKTLIELSYCPMHKSDKWDEPWHIKMKPVHAGVRVLSLDGGGIRGIVELETLQAIETALGGDLRIQAFFDIIVGTSTGGIIALGLGVQNWSVGHCISKFTDLCKDAFTPRMLKNVPVLGTLEMVNHKSMYKTKQFEKCLQESFGDRPLFGGDNNQKGYMVKVAVTSTTSIQQYPVILTNYNRPDTQECGTYKFERFDKPSLEMKLWEAARATSAAPPYFKTFIKNETKSGYLDGALYHNNPVFVAHHERKAIWHDVCQQPPDLFLSIGTGHDGPIHKAIQKKSFFRTPFSRTPVDMGMPPAPEVPLRFPNKFSTFAGQMWSTVSSRFDNILNCDNIWNSFRVEAISSGYHRRRHIRINPDLGMKVPSLDDVEQLTKVQLNAKRSLNHGSTHAQVVEVAHRLIASTFYFEKVEESTRENKSDFKCEGGSVELKALGRILMEFIKGDFEPHFVVKEDHKIETMQKVPISEQSINNMMRRGVFHGDRIQITVSKQFASTTISLCLREAAYTQAMDSYLPISGFPRKLMMEDIPRPSESLTRIPVVRSSGSFTRRTNRRRRQIISRSSNGGSNSPEGETSSSVHLRRVKSQSNFRGESGTGLGTRTTVPDCADDVTTWVERRRNSMETIMTTGAGVFELADTSMLDAGGRL